MHAGPFGNIAHGNSSIVADLIGIHGGEYLVTEAGFGADMGAERFFNIKCRTSGLVPDAAVVVATVRALKAHSGGHHVVAGRPLPPAMLEENPEEVHPGAANLLHTLRSSDARCDPGGGDQRLRRRLPLRARGHPRDRRLGGRAHCRVHPLRRRGPGCRRWPRPSSRPPRSPSEFRMLYEDGAAHREGRGDRDRGLRRRRRRLPAAAARQLALFERAGFGDLPVCIAKTHLSISSDPSLGRPDGWRLPVRGARASVGAGFIYLFSGDMRTMPGLSRPGRRVHRHRRTGQRGRSVLRGLRAGRPGGHLAAVVLWLCTNRLTIAFHSGWVGVIGFFLLPYVTLSYALVDHAGEGRRRLRVGHRGGRGPGGPVLGPVGLRRARPAGPALRPTHRRSALAGRAPARTPAGSGPPADALPPATPIMAALSVASDGWRDEQAGAELVGQCLGAGAQDRAGRHPADDGDRRVRRTRQCASQLGDEHVHARGHEGAATSLRRSPGGPARS